MRSPGIWHIPTLKPVIRPAWNSKLLYPGLQGTWISTMVGGKCCHSVPDSQSINFNLCSITVILNRVVKYCVTLILNLAGFSTNGRKSYYNMREDRLTSPREVPMGLSSCAFFGAMGLSQMLRVATKFSFVSCSRIPQYHSKLYNPMPQGKEKEAEMAKYHILSISASLNIKCLFLCPGPGLGSAKYGQV